MWKKTDPFFSVTNVSNNCWLSFKVIGVWLFVWEHTQRGSILIQWNDYICTNLETTAQLCAVEGESCWWRTLAAHSTTQHYSTAHTTPSTKNQLTHVVCIMLELLQLSPRITAQLDTMSSIIQHRRKKKMIRLILLCHILSTVSISPSTKAAFFAWNFFFFVLLAFWSLAHTQAQIMHYYVCTTLVLQMSVVCLSCNLINTLFPRACFHIFQIILIARGWTFLAVDDLRHLTLCILQLLGFNKSNHTCFVCIVVTVIWAPKPAAHPLTPSCHRQAQGPN